METWPKLKPGGEEVGTCVLGQMAGESLAPQERRELLREGKIPCLYPGHHSTPAQTSSIYHSFQCFSAGYLQKNLKKGHHYGNYS